MWYFELTFNLQSTVQNNNNNNTKLNFGAPESSNWGELNWIDLAPQINLKYHEHEQTLAWFQLSSWLYLANQIKSTLD